MKTKIIMKVKKTGGILVKPIKARADGPKPTPINGVVTIDVTPLIQFIGEAIKNGRFGIKNALKAAVKNSAGLFNLFPLSK